MLDWVLNTVLARNISSFFDNTSIIFLDVKFWMFSYSITLVSNVTNVFIESCLSCLLKVHIKHSRIWDTLPTSKMELFETIGICKVIFCRLMMLYTQYCSMSVFVSVSSLPFPFCSGGSTCKYLRWCFLLQ